MKITKDCSATEIIHAIEEHRRSAEYWFSKLVGGDKGTTRMRGKLWESCREKKAGHECSEAITYMDKSNNLWVNFKALYRTVENWTRLEDIMVILFDTENGRGGVIDLQEERKGAVYCYMPEVFDTIFASSPYDPKAVFIDNYRTFCGKSPFCKTLVSKEDPNIGYLLCHSFMLEAHIAKDGECEKWTFTKAIPTENVDFDSTETLRELQQGYNELYDSFYKIEDDEFEANGSLAVSMAYPDMLKVISDYKRSNALGFKDYPNDVLITFIAIIADLLFVSAKKNVIRDYATSWTDADKAFLYHEIDKFVKESATNKKKNTKLITFTEYVRVTVIDIVSKLLWHFNIDIERATVENNLNEAPAWSIFINKNIDKTMDKKMREQLRSITKKLGLRDKYENLIKSTRTTVDAYLDNVQPIYAISRLHKYITNDKDVPKFIEADKQWIAYIIENDKCSMIAPYVEKYSKSEVIQAIGYLLDNNLWESPLGIENIRRATPDDYKGLEAIAEAAEYLRSEGLITTEATTESALDAQVTDNAPEPQIPMSETSITGTRSDALQMLTDFEASFFDMQKQFGTLYNYFKHDDIADLFEAENKKLEKENDRLTDSIRTVNTQLKEANKEIERLKNAEYEARKERNQKIDEFNKLHKQYEDMKNDYDFLKREAQKSKDLPTYKVIPFSKLSSLPLVGTKLLSTLIPFLKGYGVQIDERR